MLAGRTDLAELIELVSRARLVVCGDTGVAHLATAFCVPSVVLFGRLARVVGAAARLAARRAVGREERRPARRAAGRRTV